MSTELASGSVSLFADTAHLARDAAQAMDRIGRDAQQSLSRAFDRAGDDLRRSLEQAGGQAADGLRQALGRASGQAGDDLRQSLSRAAGQAADGAADELRRGLSRGSDQAADEMRQGFRRASGQVGDDLQDELRRAGEGGGQQGGDAAAGGILDSLKGKAGAIGEVLGTVFAVAGVTGGGLFVKALQSGMEREKVLDLTQARLGIDDATMAKIGQAAGKAYAGNFGESVEGNIDAARRAVQSGLLDSSASAQETQKVISQLTSVSDLMGEEIPAVARAAGQAIKTGLAGNATEAFDLFTAAEQNGLNVSEDFLDSIDEYGTQFRKLGVSGPEAIGLINQAVLGGARDSDVAADAIKEFSLKVLDGSDTTSKAFKTLGFDADDLAKKFAAGGSVAREATGSLIDKIREVQDPLKRNEVALALFGTKFEDLGAAFDALDLDTAAASLGKVGGAAADAIQTMGSNSASSIDSAKRSIEVSTDAISAALAKAFGPELAKLADWVSQHQPEILGFLGKMADGAFAAADAFLAFTAVSLRAFADFAEGVGPLLDHFLDPIGKVAEVIGKLSHNEGLADLGHTLQDLGTSMDTAADNARNLADGIDNTARPGLDRMRDSVADNIEAATLSAQVFRALGDTVTALPSEHGIELKDNTPEATSRLEALGLKVTTLPNGTVFVDAKTAEGQRAIDAFVAQNTGRPIEQRVVVRFTDINGNTTTDPALRTSAVTVDGVPRGSFAKGGMFYGQGGPTSDSNVIAISNREHLAYITRAQAVNPATIPFLDAINAGWVPPAELLHGMIPGFADGGLVPGKRFAQSMDPAKYQLGGFSTSAIDCSGMVSATVNDALGLPPFSSRMATASEGPWLAAKGAVAGLGALGDINVGWVTGGPGGGHTAMTLSDGTNVESNGSEGVVVGGRVGANDPMFTNKMHIPAALLRGGDLGGGSTGGGAGSTGAGGGAGAAGGAAGEAGAGGGGSFGGAQIPAGVTPVWIVGSNGSTPSAAGSPSAATPSSSFAPNASTPANQVDVEGRARAAGQSFLDANVNDFLGTLGIRTSGGALQELVKVIQSQMAATIAEELRKSRTNAASFINRR